MVKNQALLLVSIIAREKTPDKSLKIQKEVVCITIGTSPFGCSA